MTQLHHFAITTSSLERRVAQFQAQFGFSVFAHRADNHKAEAVAMHCHSIVVVIEEGVGGWSPVPRGDWISDVAMKVADIAWARERVVRATAKLASLEQPPLGRDDDDERASFVISSPFSSVKHTIIAECNGRCTQQSTVSDDQTHFGLLDVGTSFPCLPGFVRCPQTRGQLCGMCFNRFPRQPRPLPQTSHVDHVTFACRMGTSKAHVDWYEQCLGFCQFVPGGDTSGQGYITYGDNGMRMLAMRYWQCRENGVRAPPVTSRGKTRRPTPPPVQLVFAEPLPGAGPNQVQVFLDENGCAGVQHIAFHCDDMVSSVSCLRRNGVRFISPPPEYYSMMEKEAEISQVGERLDLLRANGILIDTEVEEDDEVDPEEGSEEPRPTRYLMQVFSLPLFERETFFIELIRRCGARGFGSGNIAALWKALDIHFKQTIAH